MFLTAEDFLLDLIPMIYGKRKVLSCFPFSIGGSGGDLKLFRYIGKSESLLTVKG